MHNKWLMRIEQNEGDAMNRNFGLEPPDRRRGQQLPVGLTRALGQRANLIVWFPSQTVRRKLLTLLFPTQTSKSLQPFCSLARLLCLSLPSLRCSCSSRSWTLLDLN